MINKILKNHNSHGGVLIGAVMALILVSLIIPALVLRIQKESKDAVHEKKRTASLHLAEAGIDRGSWKLRESASMWTNASTGTVVPGYNDVVEYEDVDGGLYKIKISSGPGANQVTVLAKGKASGSETVRAIRAIFQTVATTTGSIGSAVVAPGVDIAGSVEIIWGPMMSTQEIDLSGSSNQLYPRKYARGAIEGTGNYSDRDSDINLPNTGPQPDPYQEYCAYNQSDCVPDPPTPNLDHYRTLSQTQGYYTNNSKSVNVPNEIDTVCTVGSDPKVRFYEDDVVFSGSKYFCGVLITLGDLDFSGSGSSPDGDITVTPPSTAWEEYQLNVPEHAGSNPGGDPSTWDFDPSSSEPHGDSPLAHEYPGDAGSHVVEDYNFKTGCVAHGDTGEAGGEALSFNGYIYVGGAFKGGGSTDIYGAVQSVAGIASVTGSVRIYFNNAISIETGGTGGSVGSISQESWDEIKAAW